MSSQCHDDYDEELMPPIESVGPVVVTQCHDPEPEIPAGAGEDTADPGED